MYVQKTTLPMIISFAASNLRMKFIDTLFFLVFQLLTMDLCEISDKDLESYGSQESDIVLETSEKICKVCKTGNVVRCSNKVDDTFMIYTRDGTLLGHHVESRCNNRLKPCRAGHYYGYVSLGEKANPSKPKCYDKFALKNKYLVITAQTAFSVAYLWDCLLQIVFSNA